MMQKSSWRGSKQKGDSEEIARRHIVGYYWDLMEHYEMTGSH
jgi:hypothetical protein